METIHLKGNLTPDFIKHDLSPFLETITSLQNIIDDLKQQPKSTVKIVEMSDHSNFQDTPIKHYQNIIQQSQSQTHNKSVVEQVTERMQAEITRSKQTQDVSLLILQVVQNLQAEIRQLREKSNTPRNQVFFAQNLATILYKGEFHASEVRGQWDTLHSQTNKNLDKTLKVFLGHLLEEEKKNALLTEKLKRSEEENGIIIWNDNIKGE